MVQPERVRSHPLEAFLGRAGVTDTYTHEEEDAFEYVCRHTLLRPRDLMTIGERLAALRPDERRNEHRLKEAVNQAATEIAHEYLAEIAPYVGDLELERLFHRLPGQILTRAEVEAIFEAHGAEAGEGDTCLARAVPRRPARLRPARPGARRVAAALPAPGRGHARANGPLPRATHYLIHPVLSDVIGRLNPAFLQRIDRMNIVGYDRPWREPAASERVDSVRPCAC